MTPQDMVSFYEFNKIVSSTLEGLTKQMNELKEKLGNLENALKEKENGK